MRLHDTKPHKRINREIYLHCNNFRNYSYNNFVWGSGFFSQVSMRGKD